MTVPVDLRSDTVTLPSAGMRKVMNRAKVGDSQRGEDPSVRALEEYAASLFGKEAALFVPSGTMGNLVSVASWTRPGDIIVASEASHIAGREGPGISNLASVAILGIDAPGGIFTADDVSGAIARAPLRSRAKVRLVAGENTHNAGGGTIFPIASLRRIRSVCRKADIPFHMDGSRIFNASVASGVPPSEYGSVCHSLMFCLTKGLGAPVGSVVVGSRDFVEEARSVGYRVGGGMRQAGIVAGNPRYRGDQLSRGDEHHPVSVEDARNVPPRFPGGAATSGSSPGRSGVPAIPCGHAPGGREKGDRPCRPGIPAGLRLVGPIF
jgi:threonine aldolase